MAVFILAVIVNSYNTGQVLYDRVWTLTPFSVFVKSGTNEIIQQNHSGFVQGQLVTMSVLPGDIGYMAFCQEPSSLVLLSIRATWHFLTARPAPGLQSSILEAFCIWCSVLLCDIVQKQCAQTPAPPAPFSAVICLLVTVI